jgi:signal transduction histidine kinase/CheY-like chemotaxis protein
MKLPLDDLPESTLVLSSDGTILFANKAFVWFLGVPETDLCGQPVTRFMKTELPKVLDLLKRCSRTSAAVPFAGEFCTSTKGVVRCQVQGACFERGDSPSTTKLWWRITTQQTAGKNFVALNTQIALMRHEIVARRKVEEQLRLLADRLEQTVEERTGDLVKAQDRLRALTKELHLAEQRERQRLAAELHDYLAQMLVLLKFKLDQACRIEGVPAQCTKILGQAQEILTESLAYAKTLVHDLSPPILREFGLTAGLRWLVERMQRNDLCVSLDTHEDQSARLPQDYAILLFQSVRELLLNVKKHAQSGRAWVVFDQRSQYIKITVRDEGAGFDDTAADMLSESNFGLFSVHERMKALGGTLEIISKPGKGTTATLFVPISIGTITDDSPLVNTSLTEPEHQPAAALDGYAGQLDRGGALIRVLLVDDHAMVRQGLRSVLDAYNDVEIVAEAADGGAAITAVENYRPSVVVMDINMPGINGIEATTIIKARYPAIQIIGLSVNAGGDNQQLMSKAGAHKLVTKEAAVELLYDAIRDAARLRSCNELS